MYADTANRSVYGHLSKAGTLNNSRREHNEPIPKMFIASDQRTQYEEDVCIYILINTYILTLKKNNEFFINNEYDT